MSNYKTVFFTLGILQIILGVSMFIPIMAQFIYSEIDSSFFGASIVTIEAPKKEESISLYKNCTPTGMNIKIPSIICRIPSVKKTVL